MNYTILVIDTYIWFGFRINLKSLSNNTVEKEEGSQEIRFVVRSAQRLTTASLRFITACAENISKCANLNLILAD